MKNIEKLQFITQVVTTSTITELSEKYLLGGGKWIQLRMKNSSSDEIIEQALILKKMCKKYDAKLIINDHPKIALEVKADGVHLGKNDLSPSEARRILGKDFIIGGTANSLDDILYLHNERVDYLGLGPFRFTTTKKNLSPILGTEGYQNLIQKMKSFGISIPVVAIGGIELTDIANLINTGVSGIAVSSLIAKSNSPEKITEEIINKIK